ncbi:MAG: hemolysin family protein [Candidatus Nitrospinota bacterium M3_3B_026]
MDLSLTVVLVIFFLLAEGFFSGGEFALISFNRIRLRHLAESGHEYARTVEGLLRSPDKIFGTTSVGTNVCVFAAASIVTAFMTERIGAEADLYSFIIMGPVTLVLGEIVPKMLVRQRLETALRLLAEPLALAQKVFTPLLVVTSFLAKLPLRIFLKGEEIKAALATREEIMSLARITGKDLDIAQDEKKMISRIFDFKSSSVESAMRPLVKVVAVESGATLAEARKKVAETGFSRLPVFHDRIYNIVGIISAFDILRWPDRGERVDTVMTDPLYTPDAKKNADLMREMQEKGTHMAVVVDEYGAAVGIVTMEDLLEEIVGEIEDEYDRPVKFYERLEEGKYIIDATMEVDIINEELGLDLPTGDYETLGGFMNDALERIPNKREKMAIGPYLITVLDATPRAVISVELLDLREERGGGESRDGERS